MTPRHHSCIRRQNAFHGQTSISYTPRQIFTAYDFPSVGAIPAQTTGILSLGGSLGAQFRSDCNLGYKTFGYMFPLIETFGIEGVSGEGDNDADATEENLLDAQYAGFAWSHMTGMQAQIAICAAPNASPTALADGLQALWEKGYKNISLSWGLALRYCTVQAVNACRKILAVIAAGGGRVSCAAGDNSASDGARGRNVDFCACDRNAVCVGGTSLWLNANGTIAREQAWGDGRAQDEGGGGGVDGTVSTPAWQRGVYDQRNRGRYCPDFALVSDPATGLVMASGGQFTTIGGTSGAAPMAAGFFAVMDGVRLKAGLTRIGNPLPLIYAHPECFNDITLGSNGLPAKVGYDLSTGLGSIRGTALMNLLTAAPVVVNGKTAAPAPVGAPPPVVQPTTSLTLASALAGVEVVFARYRAVNEPILQPWLATLEGAIASELGGLANATPQAVQTRASLDSHITLASVWQTLRGILLAAGPAALPVVIQTIQGLSLNPLLKSVLLDVAQAFAASLAGPATPTVKSNAVAEKAAVEVDFCEKSGRFVVDMGGVRCVFG